MTTLGLGVFSAKGHTGAFCGAESVRCHDLGTGYTGMHAQVLYISICAFTVGIQMFSGCQATTYVFEKKTENRCLHMHKIFLEGDSNWRGEFSGDMNQEAWAQKWEADLSLYILLSHLSFIPRLKKTSQLPPKDCNSTTRRRPV